METTAMSCGGRCGDPSTSEGAGECARVRTWWVLLPIWKSGGTLFASSFQPIVLSSTKTWSIDPAVKYKMAAHAPPLALQNPLSLYDTAQPSVSATNCSTSSVLCPSFLVQKPHRLLPLLADLVPATPASSLQHRAHQRWLRLPSAARLMSTALKPQSPSRPT